MRKILIITCSSFTAIVLLFALFSVVDMVPEVSKSIVLQLFAMSLSIAILMTAAEKFEDVYEISSLWTDALIRIVLCYVVGVVEGCLFGMFPLSWKALWYVTPVMVPAFIFTYATAYFINAGYAREINQSIRKKM